MEPMFDWLAAWSAALGAVLLALLVLFQRPRFLWRPIAAREAEMPPLLLIVATLLSLASWQMAIWHGHKIVERSGSVPEQLGPATVFELAFGFLRRGFVGSVEQQAYMQVAILFGALAVALAYLAVRMRYSLFAVEIEQGIDAAPRRAIVMGLSDPGAGAGDAVALLETLTLEEASKVDVGRFAWQQNLRVLAHHCTRDKNPRGSWWAFWRRSPEGGNGRRVVVLPSPQTAGHAPAFKKLAEACLARSGIADVKIEIWPRPIDYNDLGALHSRFRDIVRSLRQDAAVAARLDDISIDTTAGFKIFSIAGAVVTFGSPLEFTYVETLSPNRVLAFDVRTEFRPRSIELH